MKNQSPIGWVIHRLRRWVPAVLFLTFGTMVNAILSVSFALGTRGVIDSATSGVKADFIHACLVQGGIILGILLTRTLNRHLKDRLLMDLDRDWKRQLLHGLLHGDYLSISAYHSGELLNRLNNDVRILDTGIVTLLPSLASMSTRLVSVISVLIAMEPMFTLVVAAAGVIVILFTGIIRRNLKALNKRVSEHEGKVSGFIQETLEKLLMVQAMDVSKEMENRSEGLMEARYQVQRKRKNVSLLSHSFISVLSLGSGFAALVFCANGLMAGTMTFGTLTAVTQLISQLQGPLVNMSGIMPQYAALSAAAERLMELEKTFLEEEEKRQPQPLYESTQTICADKLSFGYDREIIFRDAEFSLEKGKFGVILGHSGIGKSTLLKLLMGIYKTTGGELYLQTQEGKVPIDRTTRRLFAYVPQGNLLLSGTLRDNLKLTKPDATQEELDYAIHISCMDDYLPSFPKGLDTVIGESSQGLSEGQAQRLSIARAVLSGAPILLLDEATSALDAQTEKLVLERLSSIPGKTCIAVTHRPAAIELADWTMEMKDNQCLVTAKQ
ncbi:MAG: ABC transporter ATP-binding protein [Ruminococcaceae bacterium]|nr:ABC transporter ATP-binding protein [Oscillospiraceae bacterium]